MRANKHHARAHSPELSHALINELQPGDLDTICRFEFSIQAWQILEDQPVELVVSGDAFSHNIQSRMLSPACQLPRRTQALAAAPKPWAQITLSQSAAALCDLMHATGWHNFVQIYLVSPCCRWCLFADSPLPAAAAVTGRRPTYRDSTNRGKTLRWEGYLLAAHAKHR